MHVKIFSIVLLLFFVGCTKDDSPTAPSPQTVTDSDLYFLAKNTAVRTFYKFSTDTLLKAGNSAHPAPKLRTWYNEKAATQLNAQGKVITTPMFPDSSLIVKEIYNTDGSLALYAVLFKLSSAVNKGPGDWVWSEMESNGNALISASEKGSGCAGCHSTGIGFTRMNDTHP